MIVIVAEKPSVGKDIARVLGCRERGEGFLRNDRYTVTWALGHLVALCEPDEMDERYKHWRMEDLPILPEDIPTRVIGKTRKQFTVVKKLINAPETESLICATDAGREGELIFRLIYRQAKCDKPCQRLWISSMTDAAIRDGFSRLKDSAEYDGLYRSAQCRSLADWLVGMNASRAFTIRYRTLLSVGRVQTPTLAILARRAEEISAFRPETYYTVTADFGAYTGLWFNRDSQDEKTASRIPDAEEAQQIVSRVRGKEGTVLKVTHEEKKEIAPQLYDLTSLQRDANQRLGFTAEKTLKLAQELYEKWKAITYPRTDSRYLPMDMLQRTAQTLARLPDMYQPFVKELPQGSGGTLPPIRRVFDDSRVSDHHAIIPTPQTARLESFGEDTRKVFDLIARRTIAAFYPPFVYDQCRVITECGGEWFRSVGRTVIHPGWKAVAAAEPAKPVGKGKKAGEEEKELPPLKEGDKQTCLKAQAKKETTRPPAPHTDASLLYAMENAGRELEDEALREQMKGNGLGTPATRAAIIERLVQVGYVRRKGRSLEATEKGLELIRIAPKEISSPETTGKWELALNEIAVNKRDTQRFMEGIRRLSAFLVDFAKNTDIQASFPEEKKGKSGGRRTSGASGGIEGTACPLCGKPVAENVKAFGCSDWKNGCRFTLWKDALTRGGGPALNEKIVRLLLQNGSVTGSTGTVRLAEGTLQFIPAGAEKPSAAVPILYQGKGAARKDETGK